MKTTVHIPDTLLEEARKIANLEQTSIKALIEEGLRLTIESRKNKVKFRLRKATFKVNGLQPNVAGASREKIRDMSYGGRGGRSLSTPTYWSTPTAKIHLGTTVPMLRLLSWLRVLRYGRFPDHASMSF